MSHRNRNYSNATEQGLSLIELLISMLLGIVLSIGVVSTYMGAKRNALYEEQLARMQESGRYAMRLLTRELMMAGFFGGLPATYGLLPKPVGADCSDHSWVLDGNTSLESVNDFTGPSVPVSLSSTRLTCLENAAIELNTDLLVIKRTAAEASLLRGVAASSLTASTGDKWYLRLAEDDPPRWEKLSPVDLLNTSGSVSSPSYWEAVTSIFFIRSYSDSADGSDDIPTLCMETLAGNAMTTRCLVEGVQDLQFEFGIDTDADGVPNQYKSAPTGDEIRNAVTARVHLLLRSINKLSGYQNTTTYAVGRKIIAPYNDAYPRQVLSSTVLLRNQIPVES